MDCLNHRILVASHLWRVIKIKSARIPPILREKGHFGGISFAIYYSNHFDVFKKTLNLVFATKNLKINNFTMALTL